MKEADRTRLSILQQRVQSGGGLVELEPVGTTQQAGLQDLKSNIDRFSVTTSCKSVELQVVHF